MVPHAVKQLSINKGGGFNCIGKDILRMRAPKQNKIMTKQTQNSEQLVP